MTSFEIIGFTDMDGFVATSCAVAGVVGGLVDYIMKREDLVHFSEDGKILTFRRWLPLLFARLVIALVAGGLVWITMNGGMQLNKENFCRFIILSFAAGLAAPALMTKLRERIETRMTKILSKDDHG